MEQPNTKTTGLPSEKSQQWSPTSSDGKGTAMGKASDLLKMNEDHKEGATTKTIENQTSKIPSEVFLSLALGSMVLSAIFAASAKRKDMANFVGLWAPSILMLGLYNKIVKTHGSDRQS